MGDPCPLGPPNKGLPLQMQSPSEQTMAPLKVTTANHIKFWQKMPEKKGSEPNSLHNGHFKAGTFSSLLSLYDSVSRDIPLQTGIAPHHWRNLMNFAIEKKPGELRASKMRTIQLMNVEMQTHEANRLIPAGQFGSRPKHQAIDLAVAKQFVWDLFHLRHQPAAWILNDAKSCFDRGVHWVAQMALMRYGIRYQATKSMMEMLQTATHRVRTGFGDSIDTFAPPLAVPFQGCGQGNGAGPTILVAISSILIEMMESEGFGFDALSCLSPQLLSAVCFCFVDDSDVVVATTADTQNGNGICPS